MKKNRVTQSKYYKSLANNNSDKLDKAREAQKRREFGIKASYRKVLKKDNLLGSREEGAVGSARSESEPTAKRNVTPRHSDNITHKNDQRGRPNKQHNFQGKDKWKGLKPSAMKKAQMEYRRKKEEKAEKGATFKRRQEERTIAIENRKKKRLEKFKILNQKTRKGQPLMKGRINMLLDKIQKSL